VILTMSLRMRKTSCPPYADWLDCVVYDDGKPIGRIYEDRHSLPDLRWYWCLTRHGCLAVGGPSNGRVPTLEEAKAQLRRTLKWLVWSKLEEA
jgi:hypothetical protein